MNWYHICLPSKSIGFDSRRSQVVRTLIARPCGAMVAQLTPDQKVASSILPWAKSADFNRKTSWLSRLERRAVNLKVASSSLVGVEAFVAQWKSARLVSERSGVRSSPEASRADSKRKDPLAQLVRAFDC